MGGAERPLDRPTGGKTYAGMLKDMQLKAEKERAEREGWGPMRLKCFRVVTSNAFGVSSCVLILLNMGCLIVDVNLGAESKSSPSWLVVCNLFILFAYLVEVVLRIFVFRKMFFKDPCSVLDLMVISVDLVVTLTVTIWPVSLALPVVLARIARLMKMTRALRMMTMFPELNFMMRGMLFASKTIIWGVVLIALLLCCWSVFAVLLINPAVQELEREGYWANARCYSCAKAFSSVQMAMLTLCQQLVVGEGWSQLNTPLMDERPETSVFFILVMVSTTLAALNLFLGAIVERATEARAISVREELAKKDQGFWEASRRLYQICQELDQDASGFLSFEEFKCGFHTNPEFADLLKVMDIDERDLEVVFSMLDMDGSGEVEYNEFVQQLHMMKSHEAHTLLVFIKFYVMEIHARMNSIAPPRMSAVRRRISVRPDAAGLHLSDVSMGMSSIAMFRPPTPKEVTPVRSVRTLSVHSSIPEVVGLTASWPELEAELQKLADIRQEMLEHCQGQHERLELVHRRMGERLRELRTKQPRSGSIEASSEVCAPGDTSPIAGGSEAALADVELGPPSRREERDAPPGSCMDAVDTKGVWVGPDNERYVEV